MIRDNDIIKALNECPTIYHAISIFKDKLLESDYTELQDDLEWSSVPSKFFIIYKNKNIIAFNNKENLKGMFFIGNMKKNLFHIEKNSQVPTLDYNFCRIKAPCLNYNYWSGRTMRVAGHINIQENTTKNIVEQNVYPKTPAAIFPSNQEINFICNSPDSNDSIDLFLGLSRDSFPFINDFPGPIIKIISDELGISPYSIRNSDLFLVDSNDSILIGNSNKIENRIISGHNISQLCPSILAFNSFLNSEQHRNGKEKRFSSFILYDENDSTNPFINDFLPNLFQKIGIINDCITLNIIPMKNDKTENKIFFDSSNKNIENILINKFKTQSCKVQINLDQKLNQIIDSISHEVIKLGFSVSNFESTRERVSLNCLKTLEEAINNIIIQ